MMRVAIATLGCKANQYDTYALMEACRQRGFIVVGNAEVADVYLVNTCTVTATADRQARRLLLRARRQHPAVIVIAFGCLGAIDASLPTTLSGTMDRVFGTADHEKIVAYLLSVCGRKGEAVSPSTDVIPLRQPRARALYKIQDGCDARCTFCIVWRARRRTHSVPFEKVIADIEALSKAGYEEVVLTGINIGSYGRDLADRPSLSMLVQAILARTTLGRLALSSLSAEQVDESLLSLLTSERRLCRRLHLSLQSGSEAVLARMGRLPDCSRALELCRRLSRDSGFYLACDMIAGFPDETDREFDETLTFVSKLPFAWMHVFPFSPRKGTPAATFDHQVSHQTIRARARCLTELAWGKREAFYRRQIGTTVDVVVISKEADSRGYVVGVSDNTILVHVPSNGQVYGRCYSAVITEVRHGKAVGQWV